MYAVKKCTIPLATKKKKEKLALVKSEWVRDRVMGGQGEREEALNVTAEQKHQLLLKKS